MKRLILIGICLLFGSACAYEQRSTIRTSDNTIYEFQRTDIRGEIGDPAWTVLVIHECKTKRKKLKCHIVRIDTTTTPSKWSSLGPALGIAGGLVGGGIGAGQ